LTPSNNIPSCRSVASSPIARWWGYGYAQSTRPRRTGEKKKLRTSWFGGPNFLQRSTSTDPRRPRSASVKPGDHPHSSHVELVTHGGKDAKVEIKDESHPAALHHAGGQQHSFTTSPFLQCLALDDEALVVCRPGLRAGVEMGTIMLWFYIVDRTALFASAEKSYIRDLFLFLFLALTIVAGAYTRVAWRTPVLLNRKQTEEWKGWMQTLFLLYHYYAATEVYNAIRVFIASYVWMTGFGNFGALVLSFLLLILLVPPSSRQHTE
jgi:hypothetical protein